MASLVDDLDNSGLLLVRLVADGYATSGGRWPVWQWLRINLQREGLDPEFALKSLPTWQHYYRPVHVRALGGMPEDSDQVALTLAGMRHSPEAMRTLVDAFLAAMVVAAEFSANAAPTPTKVIEASVDHQAFTQAVNMRAGTALTEVQMYNLLSREPATWNAVNGGEPIWVIDALNPLLAKFREVASIDDYLGRLEAVVGLPTIQPSAAPPDPLALVDAFDHLDLAWRLAVGDPLLHLPRVALGAKLALPAVSGDEFDSRMSALADVLSSLSIPGEGPSLQRLKAFLRDRMGEGSLIASDAVDVLRQVVAVRAGGQHHGAAKRASNARVALGLERFGTDWPSAWDHVRVVATHAIRTIREQLESTID